MDNVWVVPIFMLILVYASVGALLALFWVITRLAYRPARKYWRLPPKTWSIFLAGLVIQAICVLLLVGAIYVSFLPQQTFKPLYDALLALGIVGVCLSSAVLVLWLALVIRAQRHISSLDALFGQDRKKRKWVIISIVLCP
ncbi:MAG TPA: hypothetical protein VFW76_01105, partial [Ktedonobacterales bacterium]|nr:hypothetical protein [Ktedonobacterales bacterium]